MHRVGDKNDSSLVSKVCARLAAMMRSPAFASTDKLPPERILAEQLGVSRTVMREATKRLESQGASPDEAPLELSEKRKPTASTQGFCSQSRQATAMSPRKKCVPTSGMPTRTCARQRKQNDAPRFYTSVHGAYQLRGVRNPRVACGGFQRRSRADSQRALLGVP